MKEINTENAPGAIGPYSQAIRTGDTVYVSGQGPADPDSREVESVREETAQTLENISAILEAAAMSINDVVKGTFTFRTWTTTMTLTTCTPST